MPEPGDANAEHGRGTRRKRGVLLVGQGADLARAEAVLKARLDLSLVATQKSFDAATTAGADMVLLAQPPQDRASLRTFLAQAAEAALAPLLFDAGEIRSLILDDLIGRDIDSNDGGEISRRAFAGKSVLITGGGGSIGSALARMMASRAPKRDAPRCVRGQSPFHRPRTATGRFAHCRCP